MLPLSSTICIRRTAFLPSSFALAVLTLALFASAPCLIAQDTTAMPPAPADAQPAAPAADAQQAVPTTSAPDAATTANPTAPVPDATAQPATDATQNPATAPADATTQPAADGTTTPAAADATQPAAADGAQPAADGTTTPPPADATQPAGDGTTPPDTAAKALPPAPKDPFLDAGPFSERAPSIVTADLLKAMLIGKKLYLRGDYLSDNLSFNENGVLVGHAPQGSFTLCEIQITSVSMVKHKVILEGTRYGMHFLGGLPSEDPEKSFALIRLAPPKMQKTVRITIDLEQIVKPPKVKPTKIVKVSAKAAAAEKLAAAQKEKSAEDAKVAEIMAQIEAERPANAAKSADLVLAATASAAAAPYTSEATAAALAQAAEAAKPDAPEPEPAPAAAGTPEPKELTPEEQAKAEVAASVAAAPPAERPADLKSVTHTTSPVHAARVLRKALDHMFSVDMDKRMLDTMPDYWKHYFEARASGTVYRPKDTGIARPSQVDKLPVIASRVEPNSNEYAQSSGITGLALYRAIIGANGEVGDVAVSRPIGFGLDENAVAAIHKASFKPAMKDGQPIATYIDLFVTFRIYSKRTAAAAAAADKDQVASTDKKEHKLPGPYTLIHPYKDVDAPDAASAAPQ